MYWDGLYVYMYVCVVNQLMRALGNLYYLYADECDTYAVYMLENPY